MSELTIRPARAGDLPIINDIYNHYVAHSTCTYQLEPEAMDSRQKWFDGRGCAHPVTVAERNGQVVGWGALSKFKEREAYNQTVENSVYVQPGLHRQGMGQALLLDLIERGRLAKLHSIIAVIDGEQLPSIALHRKFGFVEAGRLKEAGYKFDRWLDVVYMQLML